MCTFQISTCGHPVQNVYLLRISRFYLGYLQVINHSSAASHRSITLTRQNCRHPCQVVLTIIYFCLLGSLAQGWAPPAPAQVRREPTIGPALCWEACLQWPQPSKPTCREGRDGRRSPRSCSHKNFSESAFLAPNNLGET